MMMLGNNFDFFFLFPKIGFDISNNLHEMSNPIFGKNKKNIIDLSSAEFTHLP